MLLLTLSVLLLYCSTGQNNISKQKRFLASPSPANSKYPKKTLSSHPASASRDRCPEDNSNGQRHKKICSLHKCKVIIIIFVLHLTLLSHMLSWRSMSLKWQRLCTFFFFSVSPRALVNCLLHYAKSHHVFVLLVRNSFLPTWS